MTPEYEAFLAGKAKRAKTSGFDPYEMLPHMTGHYGYAAQVAIRRGKCALFLDTGLGKTSIELEHARQVNLHTDAPTLIMTDLAVAGQIKREADRFGYEASVIRSMSDVKQPISICNYDMMHKLDPWQFGSVALDESSILKSFSGATSRALIESFRCVPFRLAATATPAPNDHMELGQHADFLGVMSSAEMLARWFKNDTDTASQTWRLKGHAIKDFWDWVASWAIMAETPDDLGFDGSAFVLPPLNIISHKAAGDIRKPIDGLFAADISATNMHQIKRHTAAERARVVAELVNADGDDQWLVWCDSDNEADALKSALPGAFEIRGSHSAERKEQAALLFQEGRARVMISKSSIFGRGLNFQGCHKMAFVGRSFSYEAWYQTVRRCWRFGQTKPVDVHLVVAEGEEQIGRVITRKAEGHAAMKAEMRVAQRRNNATSSESRVPYTPTYQGRLPAWLHA